MKRLYISLFVIIYYSSFAQTTWIKTHSIISQPPYSLNDTSYVGPVEIRECPNGNILCLSIIDPENHETITAMDSLGNVIWEKSAGYFQGQNNYSSHGLNATGDNGCVFWTSRSGTVPIDSVFRLDSTGAIIWSKYYPSGPVRVNGLIQTVYNTTLIQFQDSMIEVDSLGSYLQSRTGLTYAHTFYALPDSTLLHVGVSSIRKETFSGTSSWYVGMGVQTVFSNPVGNTVYMSEGINLTRVNWITGYEYWTLPISSMKIFTTHDQGVIFIDGSDLTKYDSTGALVWTKNFTLPRHGFTTACLLQNHGLVTGGSWVRRQMGYLDMYYAFTTSLDENGNGVCDSTNLYWPGNANDNNVLSFSDDGIFVAAAMGNSGPPTDLVLQTDTITKSTCGTDWSTSFIAGYNHKFADVNGDGIIDTTDIADLNNIPFTIPGQITPHWLRTSVLPEVKFSVSNNHLTVSDTLAIDVILGSSSNQVNSIYGLSIEMYFNTTINGNNFNRTFTLPTTAFGDSAINLFNYNFYKPNDKAGHTKYLFCRTNHSNTAVAGDTIARLYFDLSNLPSGLDTIVPSVTLNAITYEGNPVMLSAAVDTVFVSGITGISKVNSQQFNFYPNPAGNLIYLSSNTDYIITIHDLSGRLCKKTFIKSGFISIDISDLKNGAYFLTAENKEGITRNKFIKVSN